MSVGFFMGVRSSYIDEAQASALDYVAAINRELLDAGLIAYEDPIDPPDVYQGGLFGRSALDHHSARCLIRVAEIASQQESCPHLALLLSNPYRVAFLPSDFPHPFATSATDRIGGMDVRLWFGSCPRLLSELVTVAPSLGIPLEHGALADDIAARINESEALFDGDKLEYAEDERSAWLVLYEGSRLANERGVALSLAG
jgi:hypothetical protein